MLRSLFLVLVACEPKDPDTTVEAPAYAHRFASLTLPFHARMEGLFRGRDQLRDVSGSWNEETLTDYPPGTWIDEPRVLLDVLSGPDRVFVVLPSAERAGFDLAVGGLDQPWERFELNDLTLDQTGDLEGFVDPEGDVHVVFRTTDAPPRMEYVRWSRADGSVRRLDIPSEAIWDEPDLAAECEDLGIAVSPEGHVDVLYRENAEPNLRYSPSWDNTPRTRVWHARLPSGSSAWESRLVLDSSTHAIPDLQSTSILDWRYVDVGCRTSLGHDADGDAYAVVALRRLLPDRLDGARWWAQGVHYDASADRWTGADDRVYLDGAAAPAPTFATFRMQPHPGGSLLAGHSYPDANAIELAEFPLTPTMFPVDRVRDNYCEQGAWCPPQDMTRFVVDTCGNVSEYWAADPATWQRSFGESVCRPTFAPLFDPEPPPFDETVVWGEVATGFGSEFGLRMCLREDGELFVCDGGQTLEHPRMDDDGNALLSAAPADGSVDVAPDQVVTLEFEASMEGEPITGYDLQTGADFPVDATVSGSTVTVRPPGPGWPSGAILRIVAGQGRHHAWHYGGPERPVLTFRVAAEPVDEPTDLFGPRNGPEWIRGFSMTGGTTREPVVGGEGHSVRVHVRQTVADEGLVLADVVLEQIDHDGGLGLVATEVPATATVAPDDPRAVVVTFGDELREGHVHRVTLPWDRGEDGYGAWQWSFRTDALPPYSWAWGRTGDALALTLRFNVPVDVPTAPDGTTSAVAVWDDTAGAAIPVTIERPEPDLVWMVHPGLLSTHDYTVTLTDQITARTGVCCGPAGPGPGPDPMSFAFPATE
ncbi:MAG: hypothetical protein H6737_06110 [Alphaproteobacteria bacterium]|nr:hypothetical protein [Alphaproteobacteria bacterium]